MSVPIKQVSVRRVSDSRKHAFLSTSIDELKFCVEKNVWTSVLPDDELQVFVMKKIEPENSCILE
jgi:hypothetical protein